MLLRICLIFGQFQAEVAKSVAYKKKKKKRVYKYGWYSRKTFERNGIKKIIDNDGILWLNEKHIEEEFGNLET